MLTPPISFPAYGRVEVRDATNYNVNGLVGIAYNTYSELSDLVLLLRCPMGHVDTIAATATSLQRRMHANAPVASYWLSFVLSHVHSSQTELN